MVDRQAALFGSVNLDVRIFWLDFEVTLGVYDPDFAERLLALQDSISKTQHRWIRNPGISGRAVIDLSKTWCGSPVRFFKIIQQKEESGITLGEGESKK